MNSNVKSTCPYIPLLACLVCGCCCCVCVPHPINHSSAPVPTGIQPIASGPMADMNKDTDNVSMPAAKMEAPLVPVQLTNEQMNSIGVKTGTVEYKQLSDEIRATGTVDVDERLQSSVQVRFSGYIRKVFANATYQYVRKGEPLFTIYSPDLVATQEDICLRDGISRSQGSTVDGVATGARPLRCGGAALAPWDIPNSEIAKLQETGKAITDLTIKSPASGYIMERMAFPTCMSSLPRSFTRSPIFRVSG